MTHKQIWTKVNAPVDEGVADLVSALGSFPACATFESCEKSGDDYAVVFFHYGLDDQHLPVFVLSYLGPRLAKEFGDLVHSSVHVSGTGALFGELLARRPVIREVAAFIRRLHTQNRNPFAPPWAQEE